MIAYDDLKKIDFFADLIEEELLALQDICHEERYRAGEFIFVEDTQAEHLYILKSGKISIDIRVTGGEHISILTLSHFGEPLGWSALVEPFKFTASGRCVEDSVVISIDGRRLMCLMEEDYRLGFLIMRRVAKLISERTRSAWLQLIHTFYS